jgi:SAM-dependent methyltransferase
MKKPEADTLPSRPEAIVEKVRERYGKIADSGGSCCGSSRGSVEDTVAERLGYDPTQLEGVPDGANLGLGCGAPVAQLDLRPGETVLDLGSGGGLDALLAAPFVGPEGHVIGVDMTEEMIERARDNVAKSEFRNIEFRHGRLEALPVDSASVDAVTSNCVINLVPDKADVFREIARVLRPGGRVVISDIVLDGALPDAVAHDLLAYVGCVAGARLRDEYFALVESAGLTDVTVLKDIDYLACLDETLPADVSGLLQETNTRLDDLKGIVKSLTFRALKR